MIEEIKKEIKETFYIDEDDMHFEKANINIDSLFEILDKYKDKEIKFEDGSSKYCIVKVPELKIEDIKNYNNQPDYKGAWEELKTNEMAVDKISLDIMQELEQKYKLGG